MEQPPLPFLSDNNHTPLPYALKATQTQKSSSKIKPMILVHSKENEESPQKVLKNYSKALRKNFLQGRAKSYQRRKPFSKTLNAQSKLLDLKYELDFSKNFQNVFLFSQFKDLPSLSSFSLSLSNLQRNSAESFETLWKTLPHLKNLTTFELILQLFPILDPRTLTKLLNSIKKLNSLTNLAFAFFFCTTMSPLHLKVLSCQLKRFSQLQALKLAFGNSLFLNDQKAFHDLVSAFPSLSSLSKLELSFDGLKEIPSLDILELFMSFQYLKALSDLTLIFKSCEITHLDDIKSLSIIFTYLALPLLQKLRLHLFRNLDDECLRTLSQVIKKLTSLQTISFNLSDSKGYTSEGLRHFGLSLSGLISPSSLTLHVPLTLGTALGITASVLGSLCNLVKLKLQLTERTSAACGNGIKQLFTNIKHLKSIRFLEVRIPHEQTMPDDALEVLAESLKGGVTIRNLSLDFGFSWNITNKGIESLSCAIKELEYLSGLALKFGYNENINEETLSLLGEALSNRPSLESVKLTFIQCYGIKGFGTLFEVLKEMKETSDVILHIPASKIPGPEADYLKQRKIYRNGWII